MEQQNYKNHRRFEPLYHFAAFPLVMIIFVWTIVHLVQSSTSGKNVGTAILLLLVGCVLLLLVVLVREYTKKLQDRVIRVEQ